MTEETRSDEGWKMSKPRDIPKPDDPERHRLTEAFPTGRTRHCRGTIGEAHSEEGE